MAPTTCPKCDRPLRRKEIQEGRCEGCGQRLPSTIEEQAPLLEEAVPSTAEVPQAVTYLLPRKILAWGTVSAGLGQMMMGLVLVLAGLAVLALVLFFLGNNPTSKTNPMRPGSDEYAILLLGSGMVAVGGVLFVAGVVVSCAAPTGHAFFAIAATLCMVFAGILLVVIAVQGPRWTGTPLLIFVVQGLGVLLVVLYSLFLHGVARCFRSRAQAIHALIFFALFVLLALLNIGIFAATNMPGIAPQIAPFLQAWGIALLVEAGSLALWFLILLGLIRGTIAWGVRQPI